MLILHIPIECWILSLTSNINSWFYYRHKTSFIVSGSKDCTIKLWSLKSLLKHLIDVCSIVYRQHIVIITLLLQAQSIVRLPVNYTQVVHDKVRGNRDRMLA